MVISNSNRNQSFIFILLILFSCKDKTPVCKHIKLNPKIIITNNIPEDEYIDNAYLLEYTKGFLQKKDSTTAKSIINFHKKKDFLGEIVIHFDSEISTEYDYILVTNKTKQYKISNYQLTIDSAMIGMHFQKKCIIDSMRVNNIYHKKVGSTLRFPVIQ